MLSVTWRRKEVLLSCNHGSNLRIKTSLLLLLVGNIQNPTVISHQGSFLSGSRCVSGSVKVSVCGSWGSCQTGHPQLRCFFCVFPIPQTVLTPNAECLELWLVPTLPWFAKSSSWLESHLSINKLLAIKKARTRTDSKIWAQQKSFGWFQTSLSLLSLPPSPTSCK